MRRKIGTLLCALLAVVAFGCESRTDRTDSGGVILSITDFDGLPIVVAVNSAAGFVQVGELEVTNVAADPTGVVSDLMNVEIVSYEVVYTRSDNGTRIPVPLVEGLFGVAPVGGTFEVANLVIMGPEQLTNPPLSDLLFENGGFDKETDENIIGINFSLRFFGRTLSGDAVETAPANFLIRFVP